METLQPRKPKRTFKQKVYNTASTTWSVTSWIWTTIIIVFVIQLISTYLFADNTHTWEAVLKWLGTDQQNLLWNILRISSIVAIPVLFIVTILAGMLKRSLREEPEGLDRVIHVLEQDIITPQLRILHRQFQKLLQTQATSVRALSRLSDRLQQTPSSTDLKNLQALAHQALQDIHTQTTEQVRQLSDLFQQSQHTEATISADLRAIASILKQQQHEVEVPSSSEEPASSTAPEQLVSEAESGQFPTTGPFQVISALDQFEPASAHLIDTPESLEELDPESAAGDDNQSLSA